MSMLSNLLLILLEYIFLRPGFFVYEHKKIILTLILLIGVLYFREQIFAFLSYVAILYKGSSSGEKLSVLVAVASIIFGEAFFSRR